MKFWLLIIFLISAIFLIKNAESVSQSGERPKLNKTFDEIFGKGWDSEVPEFTETKEWHKMETQTTEVENKSTDQPNPNEQSFSDHYESFANRKIRERFDEMFDENWSEDDNELVEEAEADSTDQNDCIYGQKYQKVVENGKLIKRRKNVYSDHQKLKILKQFNEIKNKCKQAKIRNSKNELDEKIAKKFGFCFTTIKKWKREFGLSTSNKISDATKIEILKKYAKIKAKNPKMSDCDIADLLNIARPTLAAWQAKFMRLAADDLDHSKKPFSGQNNSTDQNENVDEQQNDSNECKKIESDQQKREIIQKFREMKENYQKKNKRAHLNKERNLIESKILNDLGVSRRTIYKWIKELGLSQAKFSEHEKREILKQFEKIKSKCKQAKLKNISMRELDKKIGKKLGVCSSTIYEWKRKFGFSGSKKKFSDAKKIGILKKYAKIKGKNPKMSDCDIADLLNIARPTLAAWKAKFMRIGLNEKHSEEADSTDHDDDVDE